jgi:hypothetical protein
MCDLDALPGYAIDEYVESIYNNSYEPPKDADEYVQGVFHIMDITIRHYGFEREFAQKMFEYKGRRHDDEKEIVEKVKTAVKERGFFFTSQAIIGECELTDIIQNSTSFFAESGQYHWIIKKPALYPKPIFNVMGRLRLWDFNLDA